MEDIPDLARKAAVKAKRWIGPKKINQLKDRFKAVKSYLKGSKRDPLFCLGVLAVFLFVIVSIAFPEIKQTSCLISDNTFQFEAKNLLLPIERIKESPEIILTGGNSLVAISPPMAVTPQVLGSLSEGTDYNITRREIIEYIVENGDSLWGVAQKYGVSINTVIWANGIESAMIQPGQKILILPVSGVMHQVRSGDTVSALAIKYKSKVEEIFAFNDIKGEGDIFEGEILIIPDGQISSYSSSGVVAPSGLSNLSTNDFYGMSHSYPYGQCTWWVAQQRAIPAWGNAIDWLPNAAAAGYSTCSGKYCIPQVGAVICLEGHRLYGHVGYVEQVTGDKVIFSEMNYIGWGKTNYRTLRMGDSLIRGYIY